MKYKSLLFLMLIAGFFIASSGGRNDARAGAPNDNGTCASCHSGGGTPTGTIDISGAPSVYVPGQTYSMSITVTEPTSGNDILSASGFQIVATNGFTNSMQGTFSITGSGTRIISFGAAQGRLVQSSPKPFTANQATWTFDWTAPSTETPDEVVFFYAGNAVNENGVASGDIVYTGAQTVLPVEWSYTNVENRGEKNIVRWGTEVEVNNSHFEIEYSQDGKEFMKIGEVAGAGESRVTMDYEFEHSDISSGKHYYRLNQVDYDGRMAFSDIFTTTVDSEQVEIYPSVINDGFISVKNGEDLASIYIYDLSGNRVFSTSSAAIVDVSTLNSGMFILQYVNALGQNVLSTRIFKI